MTKPYSTNLFQPYVSNLAIKNAKKVLLGRYIGEGPMVKKLEVDFATKFGFKHVVAVNSGTSALELAYKLVDVSKKEVITPVLTCVATNLPIIHNGGSVVFADITNGLNVCPEDIERKITKKTAAIVFVHMGGNSEGLKEVVKLGKKYKIPVIEDASHSVGSQFFGKADFTVISLQAIKTLTSVDGGLLICKSKKDADRARKLRWFGYDRELKQKVGDVDIIEAGYKYQMNDLIASIAIGNLKSIDRVLSHRVKIANVYRSYGLFAHTWLAGGISKKSYAQISDMYKKHGIEVGQHHFRNDKYSVFGGKKKLQMMDKLEDKYFFVPFHYGVSIAEAHKIGKLYESYEKA